MEVGAALCTIREGKDFDLNTSIQRKIIFEPQEWALIPWDVYTRGRLSIAMYVYSRGQFK